MEIVTDVVDGTSYSYVDNFEKAFVSSSLPGQVGEVIENKSERPILVIAWGTVYHVPPGGIIGGKNTIGLGVDIYNRGKHSL